MKYTVVLITIMVLIAFSCKERKNPDWVGKSTAVASQLAKVDKVTCAPEIVADGCTGTWITFCQVYFKNKKGIATFKCTRINKCRLITWAR